MKKLSLFILLILMSTPLLSQNFSQIVAESTCECLDGKDLESKTPKEMELEFGICLMTALSKDPDRLYQEFQTTSIVDIDMEKFGEIVGMEMVGICPMVFLPFMDDDDEDAVRPDIELGKIKSIDYAGLTTVNLEIGDGSILKFLWLWEFEGDEYLLKNTYKNKWMNIYYYNIPIFDPKQRKYITYKVIEGIEIGE